MQKNLSVFIIYLSFLHLKPYFRYGTLKFDFCQIYVG